MIAQPIVYVLSQAEEQRPPVIWQPEEPRPPVIWQAEPRPAVIRQPEEPRPPVIWQAEPRPAVIWQPEEPREPVIWQAEPRPAVILQAEEPRPAVTRRAEEPRPRPPLLARVRKGVRVVAPSADRRSQTQRLLDSLNSAVSQLAYQQRHRRFTYMGLTSLPKRCFTKQAGKTMGRLQAMRIGPATGCLTLAMCGATSPGIILICGFSWLRHAGLRLMPLGRTEQPVAQPTAVRRYLAFSMLWSQRFVLAGRVAHLRWRFCCATPVSGTRGT